MSRRLSVVIPCKNDLDGLRTTWQALAPVREMLEIALVDGGSTDGLSDALLAGEFDADHICIGEDTGIYDAMNRGWARTSAPWVWFVGTGDVPDVAGIERVFAAGDATDSLQVFRVDLLAPREVGVPDHYPARWDRSLVWRHTAHHQGVVYPRKHMPSPPFDPRRAVLADYELHLGLYLNGLGAVVHSERICAVRSGGASRKFNAGLYREEWRIKRSKLRGPELWCQPIWLAGKYALKRLQRR